MFIPYSLFSAHSNISEKKNVGLLIKNTSLIKKF